MVGILAAAEGSDMAGDACVNGDVVGTVVGGDGEISEDEEAVPLMQFAGKATEGGMECR